MLSTSHIRKKFVLTIDESYNKRLKKSKSWLRPIARVLDASKTFYKLDTDCKAKKI